jgi:hypothetical protein
MEIAEIIDFLEANSDPVPETKSYSKRLDHIGNQEGLLISETSLKQSSKIFNILECVRVRIF